MLVSLVEIRDVSRVWGSDEAGARGVSPVYADVRLSAPQPGPDRCLWLPESLLAAWDLPLGAPVELSYGLSRAVATIGLLGIAAKRRGAGWTVVPSQSLVSELNLVTGLDYRLARTGPDSIALGPVIGLLADGARRGAPAAPADGAWANLLQAYGDVKGLTVLLGPEDVDWPAGVSAGRYFDPSREGGAWVFGRFPIPAAVHRRAELAPRAEEAWVNGTGGRLFNARWRVDRWELYQSIARYAEYASKLAPACLVTSFQQLREMLDRSGRVTLKPRSGGGGSIRLGLSGGGVEALQGAQGQGARRRFRNFRELRAYLGRQNALSGRYIGQEPVESAKIGGQQFELRLVIQRSGTGEQCCPARMARLWAGDETGSGIMLPVDLALTAALGLSLEEARDVERRVIDWCCDLAKRLEGDFGTLGDVGFDVAIGPDGEPRLIECDLEPDYALFEAFDPKMHRAVSTMWHRFASFLAGFPAP